MVLKLKSSRIGYERGSEVGKGEYTWNGGMVGLGCLRVEFLLKTDSGYPKDTGVNKPWQPL